MDLATITELDFVPLILEFKDVSHCVGVLIVDDKQLPVPEIMFEAVLPSICE